MRLWKSNNIDKVWANICKYEGEVFYTVTNIEIKYVVKDNYRRFEERYHASNGFNKDRINRFRKYKRI